MSECPNDCAALRQALDEAGETIAALADEADLQASVAAVLVDCLWQEHQRAQITSTSRAATFIRAERDAARAEVRALLSIRATLDGEIARLARERDDSRADLSACDRVQKALRAEVAALQVLAQDANEAFASGRREALADLRTKVEGLRDEAIWARRGTVAENGLDTVPSAWHRGRASLADVVLALFDEEARP